MSSEYLPGKRKRKVEEESERRRREEREREEEERRVQVLSILIFCRVWTIICPGDAGGPEEGGGGGGEAEEGGASLGLAGHEVPERGPGHLLGSQDRGHCCPERRRD